VQDKSKYIGILSCYVSIAPLLSWIGGGAAVLLTDFEKEKADLMLIRIRCHDVREEGDRFISHNFSFSTTIYFGIKAI